MNINKALRKQKKSYKRFLLSMGFIFLIMPAVLFVSNRMNIFFIAYLSVIDILILVSIFIKVHNESLKYEYKQYKIDFKQGLIKSKMSIQCDKVVVIHADKQGRELEIFIITTSKFRNKRINPVEKNFLLKRPDIGKALENVMIKDPGDKYFYTIIRTGGYFKYKFLDLLYTSCVYAVFTKEAVERIKEYRNQA